MLKTIFAAVICTLSLFGALFLAYVGARKNENAFVPIIMRFLMLAILAFVLSLMTGGEAELKELILKILEFT